MVPESWFFALRKHGPLGTDIWYSHKGRTVLGWGSVGLPLAVRFPDCQTEVLPLAMNGEMRELGFAVPVRGTYLFLPIERVSIARPPGTLRSPPTTFPAEHDVRLSALLDYYCQ